MSTKYYLGFAIREEKEKRFFKTRKRQKFCRMRAEGETFAEAQELVCLKMKDLGMTMCIISPVYQIEDK